MARRGYSNVATPLVVSPSLNNSDTASTFTTTTTPSGWPTAPFFACLDAGTSSEELVYVTAQTGSSFTVTRGGSLATTYGSTTKAHSASCALTHVAAAPDFDEANSHVNASSGVHGRTGAVVGTTDAQTLTNKTLTQPVITDFTNATHTHASAAGGGVFTPPAVVSRTFTAAGPLTNTAGVVWNCNSSVSTGASTSFNVNPGFGTSMVGATVASGLNEVYTNNQVTTRLFGGTYAEWFTRVIPAAGFGGTGTSFAFGIAGQNSVSSFTNPVDDVFFRVDGVTGAVTVGARANSVNQTVTPIALPTLTANTVHSFRVQIPVAGGTANFYVDDVLVATVASTRAFTIWSGMYANYLLDSGSSGSSLQATLYHLAVADI